MIKESLDSYAASLKRNWAHDRRQTVGASEVGACARKVYWTKCEGDTDYGAARDPDYKDGWGASLRGTVFEDQFWYPAMLAKFGPHLRYAGPDQQSFVTGFLSATPDGLITGLKPGALKHLGVKDIGGDCIMAECKTADPRTNLDEAKPHNVFQTQVQMGIVRELTPFKPTYSLLSYTNASFWDDVTEFAIPFDPVLYQTAKDRATQIMTAQDARELKPEGWIAGGKECEHCPFTKACGITRRSVPDEDAAKAPDPQFIAEIADMASAVNSLKKTIGANDARLREMQQAIRDRLREQGVRKIPGVVSWSSVKGRKSYNDEWIRGWASRAGLDIERHATVGDETDRLTITAPKETA